MEGELGDDECVQVKSKAKKGNIFFRQNYKKLLNLYIFLKLSYVKVL